MEKNLDQQSAEQLVGWKRIAKHLNCSERTARRWEAEEGLPVHRHQHASRSGIYAFTDELDSWKAAQACDTAANPGASQTFWHQHARRVSVATSVIAFAVVVWIFLVQPPPSGTTKSAESARDPGAEDLYLRGRALWKQRGPIMNQRAIKLLTAAVEQDPDFAEAWAALASAWLTYPTYNDDIAIQDTVTKALLAADRAIELNPLLTEPRSVMATVAQQQGDLLRAEDIFREALAGDPDNPTLLLWFAGFYRELGMMSQARRLTTRARELDPNSPPIMTEVAMNTYHDGRVEEGYEALTYLWFNIGLETPVVWIGRWFSLMSLGEYEEAASWVDVTLFKAFKHTLSAYVAYRREPTPESSSLIVEKIMTARQNGLPPWLAFFMLDQISESEAALQILSEQASQGFFDNSVVLFYQSEGDTRQSEQYFGHLERLGYIAFWQVAGPPDICQDEPQLDFCQLLVNGTAETQP